MALAVCDCLITLAATMFTSYGFTSMWLFSVVNFLAEKGSIELFLLTDDHVQVSFIDSWLLCRKPIKRLLLQIMRKPKSEDNQGPLRRQIVYSFGDHYYFRKELKIMNLLTGYRSANSSLICLLSALSFFSFFHLSIAIALTSGTYSCSTNLEGLDGKALEQRLQRSCPPFSPAHPSFWKKSRAPKSSFAGLHLSLCWTFFPKPVRIELELDQHLSGKRKQILQFNSQP